MDLQQDVNSLFMKIYMDYCDFYSENPITVNFIITNDLCEEYKKLRPDHIESQKIDFSKLNTYNGLTVTPRNNENFSVLISISFLAECYEKGNVDWIGTIAHEITHVYDFIAYKSISGYEYEDMLDYSKNRLFEIWTEFNAKVRGYLFLRKYIFKDLYDRSQVKYIVEEELPFLIRYMSDEYGKTDNADRQLYVVAHFLAHVYVWKNLFPLDFTDIFLKSLFGNNEWMQKLFDYLCENRTLKQANNTFEDMKSILRMNFTGI